MDAFDELSSPDEGPDGAGDGAEGSDCDEFDLMVSGESNRSLSEKLGIDASSSEFSAAKKNQRFFDDLSDDEEYQNMTDAQRNERFMPKSNDSSTKKPPNGNPNLNLDGFPAELVSSDEEGDAQGSNCHSEDKVSTTNPSTSSSKFPNGQMRKNGRNGSSLSSATTSNMSSENKAGGATQGRDDSFDIDLDIGVSSFSRSDEVEPEPEKRKGSTESASASSKRICNIATLNLSEEQRKNLIIPPKYPPKLASGKRRATLVVTPASLISHWLCQVREHIDDR